MQMPDEMIMLTEALSKEIESVFPFVEMPLGFELPFHGSDCIECYDLRNDLEEYRGKEITGDAIRLVHQEMSHLSAKAWVWILPHYLRFCLTPEAEHNRMEAQFLIYNLRPRAEFEMDTLQRLSLLDEKEINCLVHFLEWCSNHQYWKEFHSDDLNKAKNFLRGVLPTRPSRHDKP
jgi:hypothetical protein